MSFADAVIAVSDATRKDIVDTLRVDPDKVFVVRHGVDHRFNPVPEPDMERQLKRLGVRPPYVLTVGAIEPRKNHVRLIAAFGAVAHAFPGVQLVIAGQSGWMNGDVFAALRASPVRDRIAVLTNVSDRYLPQLYRGATLMAYPSLYEGFGLPVVEAFACGTPVVSSNRSALPEVAGHAALSVEPTEVREIAAALRALLGDDALRRHLSDKGLERARAFSWRAAAQATLTVYEKALTLHRGNSMTRVPDSASANRALTSR